MAIAVTLSGCTTIQDFLAPLGSDRVPPEVQIHDRLKAAAH